MRFMASLVLVFSLAILGWSVPQEAKAWGKLGHLTVCDLAYRNFTPTTRRAVNEMLQARNGGILVEGRGRLPDRRYTAFNVGCLEEDALPRRHAEDHFINVARDVPEIASPSCPIAGSCILAGIDRDLAILRDAGRSREERVFALMALGHWIGDIHQPLHVSYADDKGGNSINVTLAGRCGRGADRPKNLHAVWDNCLLEAGPFERVRKRADFKRSWSRFTITYRAVDTFQANTTLTEELALVSGEPWQWAEQSYAITIDPATLYCVRIGNACHYDADRALLLRNAPERQQPIDAAYLARFAPTAEERIRLAGFRLAHLVNGALDPAYTQPIQNSSQRP